MRYRGSSSRRTSGLTGRASLPTVRHKDMKSMLHVYVPLKSSDYASPRPVTFIDVARAIAQLQQHWFAFHRYVLHKYARRTNIMAACIQSVLYASHLSRAGVKKKEDGEAMLWHAEIYGGKHSVLMVLSIETWREFHTWLRAQRFM